MSLYDTQKAKTGRNGRNARPTSKFTHIGVLKPTRKKIALLARIHNGGTTIVQMIDDWTEEYWAQARKEGLVTDAMITFENDETKLRIQEAGK